MVCVVVCMVCVVVCMVCVVVCMVCVVVCMVGVTHSACKVNPLFLLWGINGCDAWLARLPNDITLRHGFPIARLLWGLVRHTFPTTGTDAPGKKKPWGPPGPPRGAQGGKNTKKMIF